MTFEEKISFMAHKERYDFEDLVAIVEILRSEKGCPWDREQDHKSIRKDFIEETYEVIEAIDTENPELLREELGDVLLQVVMNSEIASEKGLFDFNDVVQTLCEKLIRRHPHVFGDVPKPTTPEESLAIWKSVKKIEKERKQNK